MKPIAVDAEPDEKGGGKNNGGDLTWWSVCSTDRVRVHAKTEERFFPGLVHRSKSEEHG